MILNAKARLLAIDGVAPVDRPNKNSAIENKQQQIKLIKKSMPSRQNNTNVSPVNKIQKQQNINRLQDQILNERLKEARK